MVSVGTWAQDDDTVLVVTSDQVGTYWVSVKKVAPVYPMRSIRKGEQGCAAVGYIIEPDGTTSNHRVVASFPSSRFDKPSIDAAKQFLYKPSEKNTNKEAVFTTNSFTFQISTGKSSKNQDEEKREKLAEICTAAANKSLNADASEAGAG